MVLILTISVLPGCTSRLNRFTPKDLRAISPLDSQSQDKNAKLDGARGVCTTMDPSSEERHACRNCYSLILASKCPGKSELTQCDDPLLYYQISTYVRQCMNEALSASATCFNRCPEGQVLSPTDCSCRTSWSASSNSGGGENDNSGGGGGGGGNDGSGSNPGPPLVTVLEPFENTQILSKSADACHARIGPLFFQIQNQSNSAPVDNRFNLFMDGCSGRLFKADTPILTASNTAQASFEIKTQGEREFTETLYSWTGTNETRWTPTPNISNGFLPSSIPGQRHFAGPFPSTSQTPWQLDLGIQPPGLFKLSFDLYLFYKSYLTYEPNPGVTADRIIVTTPAKIIFNQAFLSEFPLVSPTPPFLVEQGIPVYTKRPSYFMRSYGSPNYNLDPTNRRDKINNGGQVTLYFITFTFQHDGGPLKLLFAGLLEGKRQERWGFNSLKIQRALPNSCGIKFAFTDSTNQRSDYCLRFAVRTDCTTLDAPANSTVYPPPTECTCSTSPLLNSQTSPWQQETTTVDTPCN